MCCSRNRTLINVLGEFVRTKLFFVRSAFIFCCYLRTGFHREKIYLCICFNLAVFSSPWCLSQLQSMHKSGWSCHLPLHRIRQLNELLMLELKRNASLFLLLHRSSPSIIWHCLFVVSPVQMKFKTKNKNRIKSGFFLIRCVSMPFLISETKLAK